MNKDKRSHEVNVPVTPGSFPEEPGANHLKLTVFHSKGGINYATYKTEAGGYYFSVRPVEVEVGPVFASEKFTMFVSNKTAFKTLLGPGDRFNRKTLDALWAKVAPGAAELTALVVGGNIDGAVAKVTDLVSGVLKPKATVAV